MSAIRTFAIPVVILLGLLLSWDYSSNPGRYHEMAVRAAVTPLKPSDSIPTFQSVRSNLSGKRSTLDSGEAVGDGVPPNNANENIFKKNRDNTRQSAMKGLEQAWSTYCTPDGRRKLASALNYYFEMRGNEEQSYPKRWGQEGADYIKREWSTTDDRRIERLVVETYERGYLDLASVRPFIAKRMAPVLKDAQVQGQPCKG